MPASRKGQTYYLDAKLTIFLISDCDVSEFYEIASRLQSFWQLSSLEQQAVLAYIILFDNNDTLDIAQVCNLAGLQLLF